MNTARKIRTDWNGLGWTATFEDYDLGDPVGISLKSEAEAIADLQEMVVMRAEMDAERPGWRTA